MKKYPYKTNPELIETLSDQVSEDPNLKDFFIQHDISYEMIKENLSTLLIYQNESKRCNPCEGLHVCKQDVRGHQPVLVYENNQVRLLYQACEYEQEALRKRELEQRVHALYMPKMIYQASLSDFHLDSQLRKDLYHKIMHAMNQLKLNEPIKGLYLYGPYQKGKTYTLGAIANHCSLLGKRVVITYYPDLVRELKSSIRDGSLESRIQKLKEVDVLLLDDIGGDAVSEWVRDEILGPILQHRLLDEMPTFFSSNLSTDDLAKTLACGTQQSDLIKGYRIVERIKALSESFKM